MGILVPVTLSWSGTWVHLFISAFLALFYMRKKEAIGRKVNFCAYLLMTYISCVFLPVLAPVIFRLALWGRNLILQGMTLGPHCVNCCPSDAPTKSTEPLSSFCCANLLVSCAPQHTAVYRALATVGITPHNKGWDQPTVSRIKN